MTITRSAVCSIDSNSVKLSEDMVWFAGYHICRDCLNVAYLADKGLAFTVSYTHENFDTSVFDFDSQRWLAYNWKELTPDTAQEREPQTIEYYRSA